VAIKVHCPEYIVMSHIQTKFFGVIEYGTESVYHFASGLPGFEAERAFAFLSRTDSQPLLFMQSLSNTELCFPLLPILAIEPQYHLRLSAEDLAELGFPENSEPKIGVDILCGALVCFGTPDTPPTANLLAPIVLNLAGHIGTQVIQAQSDYSHRHPLIAEELVPCL
jgi:flagellar assembly factor FliW